ncbi:MAG: alpha/beta hydrolase family protein, partial [Alphaproteobacteria bacterium]
DLIFHGESDRIIPVERARAMAEALRRDSRATVRLSVLPAKGHTDTASAVYTDTLWRWLFR